MAPSVRSIAVGLLVALVAYQFAPSRLLPVEEGDAIVVTGSHTGIGKHATLSLAREGFTVFACVRKPEHGDELVAAAKKYNLDSSKVKPILLDVTNTEQIDAAVETVSAHVGDRGLYGLFNNAGMGKSVEGMSVEHYPLDSVRQLFEVNYFGLLQVTKAFLPLIRKRGGRIINNSSIAGFFAGPFTSAYCSSKFAVEALSDSLRYELGPHGVKVSVLQPGFIKTPIFHGLKGLENFRGKGIYAEHEVLQQKKAAKMALKAASPRVTSEAVVHAMRAATPQTRYTVGYMSGFLRLLASLPDTWVDAIFRADRDSEGFSLITDEELAKLLEQSHDNEFEF